MFRFKQFSVRNERAALKVGTDAVVLGAAMTLPERRPLRLLDIGTGTGVIALMAAQRLRSGFHIDAIDIDPSSVEEASENFADSPWATALAAILVPLQSFAPSEPYDAIFSNPPYFEDSLLNPDGREASARHTISLSYRDICAFAADHLVKPPSHSSHASAGAPGMPAYGPGFSGGTLSLIVPAGCFTDLERTAASFGLHLFRRIDIRTTVKKPVKRVIAEFTNVPVTTGSCSLTLQDGPHRTPEYSALTSEFYL